ncbi:MAG: hypothetical protein PHT03_07020, partial [Bacilli bacterium]|nr:hypothetical protein [Bacilli bacterium]
IIQCNHCKVTVTLDYYYQFNASDPQIPRNIPEWYEWQKEYERTKITDKAYRLETKVTLKLPDPNGKGMKTVGSGTTVLTHEGVTYRGTINNEEKEILFKIQNLPAIPFGVKEDFEISHHNTLYYFIPDDIRVCVKWSLVGEQLYYQYKESENE